MNRAVSNALKLMHDAVITLQQATTAPTQIGTHAPRNRTLTQGNIQGTARQLQRRHQSIEVNLVVIKCDAFVRIDDLFGGMTDHDVAGDGVQPCKLP